jgi:hypothetical protein
MDKKANMWSTGKNNKIRTIQMVKHFNISISEKMKRRISSKTRKFFSVEKKP